MFDVLTQLPEPPVPSGPELAEWWDILNALAASFGAIGTAGALLVAALAYRRQVENQRREHASRVNFETWVEGDKVRMVVSNRNDHEPIRGTQIVLNVWRDPRNTKMWIRGGSRQHFWADGLYLGVFDSYGVVTGLVRDVRAGETIDAYLVNRWVAGTGSTEIGIVFSDVRGVMWIRTADGSLRRATTMAPPRAIQKAQRWIDLRDHAEDDFYDELHAAKQLRGSPETPQR